MITSENLKNEVNHKKHKHFSPQNITKPQKLQVCIISDTI